MEEISKVQELVYTKRVEDVMARNVIVAEPSWPMIQAKNLMLEKRISGIPVVRGTEMIGMLTMTDVVEAFEEGKTEAPVSEHMTSSVRSIVNDASLMEALSHLGRRGHSRLPVVDREGSLVGIVTTGTVIMGLLHEMDIRFKKKEAEKLHTYRASHIFQDIVSDETRLVLRYIVDDKDFTNAGQASSSIKKSLQRLGIAPSIVRRVAVAVYEAEINLVIHTDVGGEIVVEIQRDLLHITTVDHGPGIEDLRQVLQPGFSTAPEWIRDMGFGAGMGLANIKRCSDAMRLLSEPGGATRLDIMFRLDGTSTESSGPERKKS